MNMSSRAVPVRHLARKMVVLSVALLGVLVLAGCGAEVAGAAATVGAMQADQARQAELQRKKVVDGFSTAQQAGVARAASAAD